MPAPTCSSGHGSHTLLGIELYKERPIFYSLGNLVFMNETVPFLPDEAYERFGLGPEATPADFYGARTDNDKKGHPASPKYWQGAVAVCQFKSRKLDRNPAASRRSRPWALARPARPSDARQRRRHRSRSLSGFNGFRPPMAPKIVQQDETAVVSL